MLYPYDMLRRTLTAIQKELPDATAGPTLLGDINHIGKAVIRRYGAAYRVVQVLVPM